MSALDIAKHCFERMALNHSSTVKEGVVLTHELIAYLEAMDSEADVYGAVRTADGNYVLMEPLGVVPIEVVDK